jgi:nitrogen regulatory protein P-II 2
MQPDQAMPKKWAFFRFCTKNRRKIRIVAQKIRVNFLLRNWHGPCLHNHRTPVQKGREMKLIMAIIKPFKLDDVREALSSLGVAGMTVTEVKGFGRQKGQTEIYRGAEYSTNMVPKIKVEVVCDDDLAPRVVEATQQAANSGAIGDGKIFVLDVGQAVRIRTGETGDTAL